MRGPAETCRPPRSHRLRWQQLGEHGATADAGVGGAVAVARAAGPDGDGGGSAGVAACGGDMRPVCGLVGPGRVGKAHGGPRSGPPCGPTCRMDAGVPGLPLASVSPLTKSLAFRQEVPPRWTGRALSEGLVRTWVPRCRFLGGRG